MKPKLLLRIAAALMLLHAIGHSFGALGQNKPPNERVAAVLNGMDTEQFTFMGRLSTIADFYRGYGIILIFVLLLLTIQLWLLSSNPIRSLQLTLGSFLLVQAVAEYIYFFPMAALISLLAAFLTLLATYGINTANSALSNRNR